MGKEKSCSITFEGIPLADIKNAEERFEIVKGAYVHHAIYRTTYVRGIGSGRSRRSGKTRVFSNRVDIFVLFMDDLGLFDQYAFAKPKVQRTVWKWFESFAGNIDEVKHNLSKVCADNGLK